MSKIGLLGCGNIGRILAKHETGAEIVALFDERPERAESLARNLKSAVVYTDFGEFSRAEYDILVEAASIGAVEMYADRILRQGKDLIVLSVGAFADIDLKDRLEKLAASLGRVIRIPSGALFGLDNLKIGRISSLDKLVLRTTKHPKSLGVDFNERTLLFKGSAEDCIRLYPRNVNVAISLRLAADRPVEVELWSDPAIQRNTHEVLVSGEFGEAEIKIRNMPSPDNPSTSYLAALSIIALLKDLEAPIIVGT